MKKNIKGVLVGIFTAAAAYGALGTAVATSEYSLRLFPSGEEALEDLGIPASELANLSDNPVWVKSKSNLSKFHDMLMLWGQGHTDASSYEYAVINDDDMAFAQGFGALDSSCSVTMAREDLRITDFISISYSISPNMIERDLTPTEDVQRIMLTHEIAHCSTDNRIHGSVATHFAEISADQVASEVVAPYLEHPQSIDAWRHFRALALYYPSTHDTALIVDEVGSELIQSKIFPRPEMADATREVLLETMTELHVRFSNDLTALEFSLDAYTNFSDFRYVEMYKILLEKLAEDAFESSLATRRAEMYVEAVEFFSPQIARDARLSVLMENPDSGSIGVSPFLFDFK